MKNLKATVRHESPPEGRKFEEKNEKLSWGWKEFARKDRICEKDRGQFANLTVVHRLMSQNSCVSVKVTFSIWIKLSSSWKWKIFVYFTKKNWNCQRSTLLIHSLLWSLSNFHLEDSLGDWSFHQMVMMIIPVEIFSSVCRWLSSSKCWICNHFKCATSKQMARCKTRFYLNDIHSSEIFENIFPGSSELPNYSVDSKTSDVLSIIISFYLSKRNIRNILCSTFWWTGWSSALWPCDWYSFENRIYWLELQLHIKLFEMHTILNKKSITKVWNQL